MKREKIFLRQNFKLNKFYFSWTTEKQSMCHEQRMDFKIISQILNHKNWKLHSITDRSCYYVSKAKGISAYMNVRQSDNWSQSVG